MLKEITFSLEGDTLHMRAGSPEKNQITRPVNYTTEGFLGEQSIKLWFIGLYDMGQIESIAEFALRGLSNVMKTSYILHLSHERTQIELKWKQIEQGHWVADWCNC